MAPGNFSQPNGAAAPSTAAPKVMNPNALLAQQAKQRADAEAKRLAEAAAAKEAAAAASAASRQVTKSDVPQQHQAIISTLEQLHNTLQQAGLKGMMARQLGEFSKAITGLIKAFASNGISDEVAAQLHQLCQCLDPQQYNFAGAMAVHKGLAGSVWGEHKVWLKPLKTCIDVARRTIR